MNIHKNKGMFLESIINSSNQFYYENNIAIIHKKNLDIDFKSIDLKNKKLVVNNAFIKSKSTVDYYGIYKGIFLAFEAKSTNEKNFSLSNVKRHQIEYLSLIASHQGLAFWIIYFNLQNKFIVIKHDKFMKISKNKKTLAYSLLLANGISIELDFPGILDYLKVFNFDD
ncbi:Holliday junction resolvase RecU [Mycoplasma phocoeninasale]|uniref:Holliday junction resolvase RecU n=1 Tax=Mycoplasma phocoeninasale TaxID=2726117 RepID=UPI0019683AFA|nr:Holliday junction resolvase RecU [Mycoplasma phocoeninasale]MBN0970839.1 Holliday junction resolvase RecU [Mycoplasma phocoeninasale]